MSLQRLKGLLYDPDEDKSEMIVKPDLEKNV